MMMAWIVPVAVSIIGGMVILFAKIAGCAITASTITLVPIAENAITWKVAKIADDAKIALFFVPTAELATFARAVTEISVITASCAVVVRSYARGATKLVNNAPMSFAPIAENVVRSVTIIFANFAKYATSAPAVWETSAIIAIYAVIVRSYARDAAKLAKRAPTSFAPIAENVVRCVTIIFVSFAKYATSAQAA